MTDIAVLIDGGYLRVITKKAKKTYNPDYIEKIAHACVVKGESLFRVLYYDCGLFKGTVNLPISGGKKEFDPNNSWLAELAQKNQFAVRRGVLKFRGWKPKRTPVDPRNLSDADFDPDFEQKGVDMRLGLDIASYSAMACIKRMALVTGDTDLIPAMKHGRKSGLQMVLVRMPNERISGDLIQHADFVRDVAWPA